MIEEWKDIIGYEGLYEISNTGKVKSRKVDELKGSRDGKNKSGYERISLSKEGIISKYKIHILVALYFIGERPEGYVINHIDGDKINNNVDNLEYVTTSRNLLHAIELGLKKIGSECSYSKSIVQMDYCGNDIKTFGCIRECADELKLSRHNIASCCRNEAPSCGGFRFRFIGDTYIERKRICGCGKEFIFFRSDKKHCSPICKSRYRVRKKNI